MEPQNAIIPASVRIMVLEHKVFSIQQLYKAMVANANGMDVISEEELKRVLRTLAPMDINAHVITQEHNNPHDDTFVILSSGDPQIIKGARWLQLHTGCSYKEGSDYILDICSKFKDVTIRLEAYR